MLQYFAFLSDVVDDPTGSYGIDECSDRGLSPEFPLFKFFENIDHDLVHHIFPIRSLSADRFFNSKTDDGPVLGDDFFDVDLEFFLFHLGPII